MSTQTEAPGNHNTAKNMFVSPTAVKTYRGAETITGPYALALLKQAGFSTSSSTAGTAPPISNPPGPLKVLDNACGTGVVTATIYNTVPKEDREGMKIVCGDFSEAMVGYVADRIRDEGWDGAEAKVVDASKTGLADEAFTHVITNFGVMLMPDPDVVMKECHRILVPSGICALTTWITSGWVPIISAAFALLPTSPPFPSNDVFVRSWSAPSSSWTDPAYVSSLMRTHGFDNVTTTVMENTTVLADTDWFWRTFEPMLDGIMKNWWSEEDRQRYGHAEVETVVRQVLDGKIKANGGVGAEMYWEAVVATGRKAAA
ncbi:MAG: hypothetical protein M1817_001423 [Caeruleum heppii]|nr:MAG: hypothetical protein M1817_001423 [Caeruleum heppii]